MRIQCALKSIPPDAHKCEHPTSQSFTVMALIFFLSNHCNVICILSIRMIRRLPYVFVINFVSRALYAKWHPVQLGSCDATQCNQHLDQVTISHPQAYASSHPAVIIE